MLDLNITLIFQLINFIIAIFFLNILLIRPIREIIKKRNALMDYLANEADAFHSDALNKLQDYEKQLAETRQMGNKTREEGKAAGLEELQAILGTAQQSAKKLLEDNRDQLHNQAEQALSELRDGIDDFSTKLGNKLLGN